MGGQMLRKADAGKIGTIPVQLTFWRRHGWLKWCGLAILVLLLCLGAAAYLAARYAEPFLRAVIVDRLEERFHARVELDRFHVSLAHGLKVEGNGLRIWPPSQVAGMETGSAAPGKPLIQIAQFGFRAPLLFRNDNPIRISGVALRGVIVDVPPRSHFLHSSQTTESSHAGSSHRKSAEPPGARLLHFLVAAVTCQNARLILENSNPAKSPLEFDIQSLSVTRVSFGGAMDFTARLTNPRPRGMIETTGKLGPWSVDDPGSTPLQGSYSFNHADLGTFRGIAGTLNSTGRYRGSLRELTVDGATETPNFALTSFGTALPLHTTFHARVDATNGDTWLEPVNAVLGRTNFVARGKIVELAAKAAAPGKPAQPRGHQIALHVIVNGGQIAGFLRLASHSGSALLTGNLHMKTALEIPPGRNPVEERMRLKGTFLLDDARFTSPKIQDRVAELSLRGQGKPKDPGSAAAASVLSTMTGRFTMAHAVIALPNLKYMVPGAVIDLKGTYDVDGGGLNFNGVARMQATLSQMVGGWKGLLLKPVDPLFRKDGAGTRVRVHINGTRRNPHFGIHF